ncbi:MAG TPA: hypothetical protein VGL00_00560 [Terracidiphilus sp.]|jgi:hypothetical protein
MEIIGFVIFQIVITVLGLVVGGIFAGVMWWATRSFSSGRKSATTVALFFPVAVLFYLEGTWLAYGLFEDAMGRDTYVEGIYHYSLAHDYQLVIMDKMPEQAYVENVKRLSLKGISEVRGFQVAGNLIIVTSHRDESGTDWGPEKKADQYSIIDGSSGAIREFGSESDLRTAAFQLGLVLHLESVKDALSMAVSRAQPNWSFWCIVLFPIAAFLIRFCRSIRMWQTESRTVFG